MPALKKGLSGLERYEVKVSRTVLRGGSDGNVTLLPGSRSSVAADCGLDTRILLLYLLKECPL